MSRDNPRALKRRLRQTVPWRRLLRSAWTWPSQVFQVHGVAEDGRVVIRRALRRSQVLDFFRSVEPCLVGLEACASAHHWANAIGQFGHTVRMMPPAYVKAYVKRNKTDAADAEAICEAVTRPTMRFVPIKSPGDQAAGMVLKTRELFVRQVRLKAGGVLASRPAVARGGAENPLSRCRSEREAGLRSRGKVIEDLVMTMDRHPSIAPLVEELMRA